MRRKKKAGIPRAKPWRHLTHKRATDAVAAMVLKNKQMLHDDILKENSRNILLINPAMLDLKAAIPRKAVVANTSNVEP